MVSLRDYDYHLPPELIAHTPASPREHAKLLVYNTATDTVTHDTFSHIGNYLPHPALLLMNDTQVVPARAWLKKPTGGKIEVLFFVNEHRSDDTLIKGIVDRKIALGTALTFQDGTQVMVEAQEEQHFFFRTSISFAQFLRVLDHEGETPIPPYIKVSTLDESTLRKEYQSVLATHPASIAAPTASLHFSEELLSQLTHQGVPHATLTLHVGAGTFMPIDDTTITRGTLFKESFAISAKTAHTLRKAHELHTPIIPVGTTAMRTLESVLRHTTLRELDACRGDTDIFIYPPFDFRGTDHFITNFHVPKSSLMLLVDAFLKHKKAQRDVLALYRIAIEEKYRFYSFGDGMLIL
jgi:S-adenosylmethionine:tRNA ribosyltransferase-isomerase